MIKQEVLEQVRAATDIIDLVGGYLPLKKVGRNYRGLCPFHSERSPSFYVNPERQTYHCFGCGVGGGAFNFVMALEKLEFPEAVRFLAKRAGIRVETEQVPARNQALYDACEMAASFYEQQLTRSQTAQDYLRRRELGSETTRRFRLGFAPGGNLLRGTAKRKGVPEEQLLKAGLLVRRDEGLGDYFHDRLMFPIFSVSGKVVGFGGRVLGDSEPKYLNSPDTPVFHKSEVLYGLFQAKAYLREETPVLVEGNFDLLSLVDRGINRVVAPLGTALTPPQAQMLRRYGNRVAICFDGDAAGRKAARRALEVLLGVGIEPVVAALPDGTDPDSFIRQFGRERLLGVLGEGHDFVDFVLGSRPLGSVAEQREALGELVALLNMIADPATRELYANRVADRFRVDKSVLLRGGPGRRTERSEAPARRIEERLLGSVVQWPDFARIAREYGLSTILADDGLRRVCSAAEERSDDPAFGPGMVMDAVDDEKLRCRIAGWTFTEQSPPGVAEFRERVRRLRAEWLHRRIVEAEERGDNMQVEELSRERNALLQKVSQERSCRR